MWLILLSLFAGFAWAAPEDCERWITAVESGGITRGARGVVVLAHGMNLLPSRMDQLGEVIASAGYDVYRPAFAGHCGENKKYLNVTAAEWEADARRIYVAAAQRAQGKPISLVAYSFSSLVFQALRRELPFAHRVYLAAPLAVKFWYPLVILLARAWPGFEYESRNLPGYAANRVSGARAFLALDEFKRRWDEDRSDIGGGLILADPSDELVSFSGLESFARENPAWRVEAVSNSGSSLEKTYHHLIIDEDSLGAREWARMRKMVVEGLE